MPGPIAPYLKLGVICQYALQEKDGVLSLIRIVDRFTLEVTGKEPPAELPPMVTNMTIVMVWAGGLGSHETSFSIVSPDGIVQQSPQTWPFNLDALNRGHNIIVTLPVKMSQAGVYWVEFILDGEVRGRAPFQVVYERRQVRA